MEPSDRGFSPIISLFLASALWAIATLISKHLLDRQPEIKRVSPWEQRTFQL